MPFVAWQVVKIRPIEAGKGFQLVKRLHTVKGFSVHLHGRVGGVTTSTAHCVLFQVCGVRRAVCAQKEFIRSTGGCRQQGLAVHFALQHWQAVKMRPHAAQKDGVAVVQQVVRGDGGRRMGTGLRNVLSSLAGGDVFHHDF